MEIRRLGEGDAEPYWKIRLEALRSDPFAFGMAAEEHESTPVEVFSARFRETSADQFTLGAFESKRIIGIATFVREEGRKERHKGHVYGVYVTVSRRGGGVGRALLTALLEQARGDVSLEQIQLAVGARQTAASELYRQLGFRVFGREPRALKVGFEYVDEEHMVLILR